MTVTIAADDPYVCGWDAEICCDSITSVFAEDPQDPTKVAAVQMAVNAAAEVLHALSGRQFGLCQIKVRPCRIECCNPCEMSGLRWTPALIGGEWTNVSCSRCKTGCSCKEVCEVVLPGPIYSVEQILLNGEVLPATSYRVDDNFALVRTDGGDCWPTCQEMGLDPTEDGTWEVTYTRGRPVPDAGRLALGELACEFYKSCIGDSSCCLPGRVTSVNRQGVSFSITDPIAAIKEGSTGVFIADLWIRSVNPNGLMRRAAFLSPDMPIPRRTTWP